MVCPLVTIAVLLAMVGTSSAEDATGQKAQRSTSPATIVIGFVGGFVHRDDMRHVEVQLVRKLRAAHQDSAKVDIFQNRQRDQAYHAILKWLDTNHDGKLSDDEKSNARIILFGHSWGASATLALARRLEREKIPVLLTVQVDSISRRGQNDGVVPPNVAKAVNFYQSRGLLHGRSKITAADPKHTQILGDFRFDYKKEPAECEALPWYDRYFFKGHTSIECDPMVWSRIEALISSYLPSGAGSSSLETALH
jgi:hypothetical protein